MADGGGEILSTIGAVGAVIIGRNEGDRLKASLDSVVKTAARVVYVDSGSSDGSIALAQERGAEVVRLDQDRPFTAGRARNAGFKRLRELAPDLTYVQFIDGDCELQGGWLEEGARYLDANADVAVVCGRLRERYPERSIYNTLCDIEWDLPPGAIKSCGGNALFRVAAFEEAGGFHGGMIAGEEPELCVRLRGAGWRVWNLDRPMALHDAAITRFGQWWNRTKRAGYAFALGASLHGRTPERHWRRESLSAWLWGMGLPLAAVAGAVVIDPLVLLLLCVYPLQVARIALRDGRYAPARGRVNWWRALFIVVGKFPETIGQVVFLTDRCFGRTPNLIEYK
jgi:GT2 family glycosyltransferase